MDICYIYYVEDPFTLKPTYIGKTTNYPLRRAKHRSKKPKSTHPQDLLANDWMARGRKPELRVLECCPKLGSTKAEAYWTWQFKTWGFELTNHNYGSAPAVYSQQHRDRIGTSGKIAQKGTKTLEYYINKFGIVEGTIKHQNLCKKISSALTGKKRGKQTKEWKAKRLKSFRETIKKRNNF